MATACRPSWPLGGPCLRGWSPGRSEGPAGPRGRSTDPTRSRGVIYRLDWGRAWRDGDLDAAVLDVIDDAAINGCRPEFVTIGGRPLLEPDPGPWASRPCPWAVDRGGCREGRIDPEPPLAVGQWASRGDSPGTCGGDQEAAGA